MSEQNELSSELSSEEKKRVHVLLFRSDWDKLGLMYGDSVKRGNVIRSVVRDFIKRIEAKREQRL